MVYITCSRRYSEYFTKAIHVRQGSLRACSMVEEGCLSMRCAYTFQMQYNILQRRWCNSFLKAQAYVGRPAMDLLIATAVRVDGQHASTIAYDLYKLLGWRCVLKYTEYHTANCPNKGNVAISLLVYFLAAHDLVDICSRLIQSCLCLTNARTPW